VTALPASVGDTARLLADQGYIADRELATTVHLALVMERPLLLEGEPGPYRDIVLLNSAAALVVADRAQDIMVAKDLAARSLEGGAGLAKLKELIKASNA
jgi:anthranilate phosphoribosyltransferase